MNGYHEKLDLSNQIKIDRKKMRLKHPDELEAESKKLRDQSKLSIASTKPDLNFKPLRIDYN